MELGQRLMIESNTVPWLGGHPYKERRTDTHVYFVGGPFSQWWSSDFIASPFPGYPEDRFVSCEQYMMASKALLFHDADVYQAIMRETNPKVMKELGRKVRHYDDTIWRLNARELVFRGNLAKFKQNTALLDYILETGDRMMVEGASYDPVWGVKLAWNDPAIENVSNWRGTNWLGETLMRVKIALATDMIASHV